MPPGPIFLIKYSCRCLPNNGSDVFVGDKLSIVRFGFLDTLYLQARSVPAVQEKLKIYLSILSIPG